MIVGVTVSSNSQELYAENKAKKYWSQYDGEWNDNKNKCEFDDHDGDKAAYEDFVYEEPEDTRKYKNVC